MTRRHTAARDLDRALDARARSTAGSFLASTVWQVLLTLAPDHAAELDRGAVADPPQLGLREPRQQRGDR